jgi:hypothetical protein
MLTGFHAGTTAGTPEGICPCSSDTDMDQARAAGVLIEFEQAGAKDVLRLLP